MEEPKDGQNSGYAIYIYVFIGAFAFSYVVVKNIFTQPRMNQTISNVVPSDITVRMQPIMKSTSSEKIAVISMNGLIGMPGLTEKITAELRSASSDKSIKAVILKVNSPGGGVYDIELIWREVVKFKESKKPLVAFMNGVAASGGYYISAPADKIMATPATITGSIGVIIQAPNYSGLMQKLGLEMMTFKSGEQKDMLSPYRKMDPETAKILQEWIDESYDEFVRVVSRGRKIDEKTVRKLADGRIYTARQAARNHLIDSTGYFEDAVELAKKLAKAPDAAVMEMNAIDMRALSLGFEKLRMEPGMSNPLDRFIPPAGAYYLAPGFYEKYLK